MENSSTYSLNKTFEGNPELIMLDLAIYRPEKEPYTFQVKALWDTGSNATCISNKIVEQLGYEPIDTAKAETIDNAEIESKVYKIKLLFPAQPVDFYINVERAIADKRCDINPRFDVIIGMDVINCGDSAISHHEGKTFFSFCSPSKGQPIIL